MNLLRNKNLKILSTILLLCAIAFVPIAANALSVSGILTTALGYLAKTVMELVAFGLSLVALLFEYVLKYTIAEMSTQVGPEGLGPAISDAWGTLRDLANLAFIFVLLYAAIKVIFDLNVASIGQTIKNIIIVGLLINFSLFFTKIFIDAANIPTIGFYNAINAGAGAKPVSILGGIKNLDPGITTILMNVTGLQTFYGEKGLNELPVSQEESSRKLLINSILASVAMLVMAVILLVATVMFATRFILLIVLMVLSPAAAIAYIIPGAQGKFKEWFGALKNQAFFAPVFMLMLWVSIKIINSLNLVQAGKQWSSLATLPKDTIGLVINYTLCIGFMIAALITSKKMASSTFGFSAISGALGTGVVGGAAIAGRQTLGRAGRAVTQSTWLRDKAATSRTARLTLRAGGAAAESSFDLRASKTAQKASGGTLGILGKAGGKGGYEKTRSEQIKREEDFGKKFLSQTPKEKIMAGELERNLEEAKRKDEARIKDERAKAAAEKRREHQNAQEEYNTASTLASEAAKEAESKKYDGPTTHAEGFKKAQEYKRAQERARAAEEVKKEAEEKMKRFEAVSRAATERQNAKIENDEYSEEIKEQNKKISELKDAGKIRQRERAEDLEKKKWTNVFDIMRTRKERAAKLRDLAAGKTGKSKKEVKKFLEDANLIDKEEGEEGGGKTEGEAPKPAGGTTGPTT